MKRGEIWLVSLDPTMGSEIRKTRPCMIISPPELHDHLRTVIVAPMTSACRPAGYRIPVRFDDKDGLVLTEQVRTLDKRRLIKRLGEAPAPVLTQVLRVMREIYEE